MGVPVIVGDNLHSPSGIGLTDLPNIVEGLDSLNIKLYLNKETYLDQAMLEPRSDWPLISQIKLETA